ncbi:MAG: hypothetical protein KDA72_21715, partial [Planctomycetales bacterium]|nr:hypothetical protein [Planctomycetales bacterium]
MRSTTDLSDASNSPFKRSIAKLSPAYFALVMATGIVSIASQAMGYSSVAWTLLCINVAAYS